MTSAATSSTAPALTTMIVFRFTGTLPNLVDLDRRIGFETIQPLLPVAPTGRIWIQRVGASCGQPEVARAPEGGVVSEVKRSIPVRESSCAKRSCPEPAAGVRGRLNTLVGGR